MLGRRRLGYIRWQLLLHLLLGLTIIGYTSDLVIAARILLLDDCAAQAAWDGHCLFKKALLGLSVFEAISQSLLAR